MDCPACASRRAHKLVPLAIAVDGRPAIRTWIWNCRDCTHRFLRTSDEEQRAIETIYGHHYTGYKEDPLFARRVREELDRAIAPRRPPPARLLDVGCGAGEFLAAATERGYRAEGIEVSEAAAALCRGRGLAARSGDFLATDFGGAFDLVTMWDVVEHLREPAAFMRRAAELLAPGGVLILKIPGFGLLSFPPIAVVPKVANVVLGAPAHVQYFNRRSLAALLARAGFARVDWLPARGLRSATTGGSLKKRVARAVARGIATAARNRTLFVAAAR